MKFGTSTTLSLTYPQRALAIFSPFHSFTFSPLEGVSHFFTFHFSLFTFSPFHLFPFHLFFALSRRNTF